jgi:hypothetical protein
MSRRPYDRQCPPGPRYDRSAIDSATGSQEQEDAQVLAEWLRARKGGAPDLKQVAQSCPHRLRDKARRTKAIALLQQRHVARLESVDGRTVLMLNPKWAGAVS